MKASVLAAVVLLGVGCASHQPPQPLPALPAPPESAVGLQGEAVERFLATARIIEIEDIPVGITRPERATLELDGVRHDAAFKEVDEPPKPGGTRMDDGTVIASLQDSFRLEIAAYVVDRIIGLGMVPATVERKIRGHSGSLQWWVSGVTETERVRARRMPPDLDAWDQEVQKFLLFDELICNIDRNSGNLMISDDFHIRLIDHSRSFPNLTELRNPDRLKRFSRSLLDGLERLELDDLRGRLVVPRYLLAGQVAAIIARRDLILELARQRVAELGEDAVLYK